MPQKVYANIVDHLIMDDGVEVEDVTSITLPDVDFTRTEFDPSGMAGVIELANPTHLEKMSYTIAHNNGRNTEKLSTPEIHQQEFRIARQNLDVAGVQLEYSSVKYRVAGQAVKTSDGSVERGNPLGSTVEYACIKFIKEIDGAVVTHIDLSAGIVIINGRNYSDQIRSILNG